MRTLSIGLRLSLALFSMAWFDLDVSGGPWPRFRGPNGTGISSEKDIPVRWGEKDGVVWKTKIPGVGNSSPVTWETFVFLQSSSADGNERRLMCLDAGTGKVLWSRSVTGAKAAMHPKNSMASSTPATDGVRVYALFWAGQELTLNAYDLQGNPVWNHKLGTFTGQHGAGASPVVYGDKVFLANDQDGSAALVALDAKTGQEAWQAPRRPFRACYSTPFLLEEPGRAPELIVSSTAGITSYNPQSGAQNWDYVWKFTGMALRTIGSPLYHDGLIIANSGDGSGARDTIAIKIPTAGNPAPPSLVWQKQTRSFPYVPTMLVYGDYLFFVNDVGVASCCDAKTGKEVWTQRLGSPVSASPILIDGKIYSVNEDGTVHVFEAGSTFKLLAKNSVGESVLATPAAADNRLFIRGKTHLFCISKTPDKESAQR
ncbi:MAG TPA: PQQ-binding-like beta-propeller repeat protein [Gemmataceae bacterium]|nr:PQQ-binding-like beta-propeller repeat protein [Gemmataceae bacterium]